MSGLGSGISPPNELTLSSEQEANLILVELREIRLAGENLSNQIKLLETKIISNLKHQL
jgi:hypothetical protein